MRPEIRPLFCEDASPVFFNLFDFSIAPPFLYYAYVPIIILLISFSFYILVSDNFSRHARLLSGIAVSMAIATGLTLLQWIAAPVAEVMFAWQLWNLANVGIFVFTALLVAAWNYSFKTYGTTKLILSILILPVIILTPTALNIGGFDFAYCEGIIGPLFTYAYLLDVACVLFVVVTFLWLLKRVKDKTSDTKDLIVTGSSAILLLTFLATTYIADIVGDYRIEMIGALGGVIFIASMAYVSVKYRLFNVKMIATELFVAALVIVIASILFIRTIETVRLVVAGSVFFTIILGYLLIGSVRREVKQRQKIEELAKRLAKANGRLKILDKMKSEFVSIASHQLRSPLTAIRGYTSMLLEGSYGKLSKKAEVAVQRIHESSRFMALSVEDYLNVSRIEAGNMKYETSDFNLKSVAEKVVDEIRPAALKKGLLLVFRSDCNGSCSVNADIGKTRQVIMNLIDNAMKYTPKGSITVIAHDDVKKKKMFVTIKDTGVGMTPETIEDVFDKFVRADNANRVNVTGTGLGLYVAKKMVEEMNGRIWAESEGEGEGATFHIELPLLPGKYQE